MKSYKRARRRQIRAKLIKRTAKLQRAFYGDVPDSRIKRLVNNMTCCSCPYCMNERHNKWLSGFDRLTMQERRQVDKYKYEVLSIREE